MQNMPLSSKGYIQISDHVNEQYTYKHIMN